MSLSDQLSDIISSLGGFGPIGWLSVAFCGLLLAELLLLRATPSQARRVIGLLTLLTLVVAGLWAVLLPWRGFLFMRLLYVDNQALFFQVVVALSGVLVVGYERLMGADSRADSAGKLPLEWYALLVAMTLGLFLMTQSVNLLSLYLSVELVSICSYLLTALTTTRKASEGGIKYLLFGAVSSAIMLYGMSLLYGMTGTLDLTADAFGAELARQDAAVATVAVLLTLSGLLFKLAGVPFHVWTPDAYEAAPVPVAAFFSVAPKAAAVLVLMRVITALPVESESGAATVGALQTPLAVLALAGILIGNLSALRQTDAKRLLAYSSIAHAGFLLVGVVALNEAGFEAVLFYAGTYLFISLAAFFLIDLLASSQGHTLAIRDFAGLGSRQPVLSVALTVVMLALTGLPPTVGFTAKLLSFSALYDAWQLSGKPWLLALFALGLLNALISLVYYLRIPFLLFFRPMPSTVGGEASAGVLPRGALWLAVGLVVPILAFFLKPDWLAGLIASW
ncbi:NADH-quinone oxidoreductase subunit N [Spirosoma sordidisoli]|uniref:NADH-quinone oxidoreductase subunit N n=1 Tax=Spirosoma sordidisoli TaxID=2502893 RepID=A0A4Q2UY99_9BACT|nr:NADH-quinone oxidoreductase subunit N [Spirosoma sordidisoli]RYC72059.1 NADH-quinone oxidoreductase subunit N [Spirosoma sordidisoli]